MMLVIIKSTRQMKIESRPNETMKLPNVVAAPVSVMAPITVPTIAQASPTASA